MVELIQTRQTALHHVMGTAAMHINNKGNTARIMLEPRVVQTLGRGQTEFALCCFVHG